MAVHRLRCSEACGLILDQGLHPCLLHWQADSLPLSRQGSPMLFFYLSGKVLSCSMQDLLSVAACAIFSCGRWALKFPDPSWAPQIRSMESLSLDQPASPQGRGLMGGKVPGLGARKRVCKVAPGAACKAAAQPQDIGAASLLQKRCPSHYRGLECKSRMSRNTWSNRQIWPWSTE